MIDMEAYREYWRRVVAETGGRGPYYRPVEVKVIPPVRVREVPILPLCYVRDTFVVTAAVAAAVEYARVWDYGQKFYGAAVLFEPGPMTRYDPVWVHSLEVKVVNPLGYWARRGSKVDLINCTDQPGEMLRLHTSPSNGVQGFNGVAYDGPPFLCTWACGWWVAYPALSENDIVYTRIGYTGV